MPPSLPPFTHLSTYMRYASHVGDSTFASANIPNTKTKQMKKLTATETQTLIGGGIQPQ